MRQEVVEEAPFRVHLLIKENRSVYRFQYPLAQELARPFGAFRVPQRNGSILSQLSAPPRQAVLAARAMRTSGICSACYKAASVNARRAGQWRTRRPVQVDDAP